MRAALSIQVSKKQNKISKTYFEMKIFLFCLEVYIYAAWKHMFFRMCTSEVTLKGVKSSFQNYSYAYEYSVFLNGLISLTVNYFVRA